MNYLPYNPKLQIKGLVSIFSNTTNSYKFYWFWAILDLLKQEENPQNIPYREIVIRMISLSWYTVNYFKLSLGRQDKLSDSIRTIIEHDVCNLTPESSKQEIEDTLRNLSYSDKKIQTILDKLANYVPTRFLRPFFANEKIEEKDADKKIEELSANYFEVKEKSSIYKVNQKAIILQEDWREYLLINLKILEDFCLWNLANFLQSRNPNIPNIGNKLIAPNSKRDLKQAKKFWDIVLENTPIRCIYSHKLLTKGEISIDHFVPWSFVAHDLLWNLSPTISEINSSKSNKLPCLSYLADFSKLQHNAFKIVYNQGSKKLLEDYNLVFQDELDSINEYSPFIFENKIKTQITPLIQIAGNMGFQENWSFK